MRTITILFLLTSGLFAKAQRAGDIAALHAPPTKKATAGNYVIAQNNASDIELVFSGLFLFYKHNISSQDGNHCSFYPSCSEYALTSIKRRGAVMGIMDFFDRFSRCNSLSPQSYPVHPKTKRLYDPPF